MVGEQMSNHPTKQMPNIFVAYGVMVAQEVRDALGGVGIQKAKSSSILLRCTKYWRYASKVLKESWKLCHRKVDGSIPCTSAILESSKDV